MDVRCIVRVVLFSASSLFALSCAPADSGEPRENSALPDFSALEIEPIDPVRLPAADFVSDLQSADKIRRGTNINYNDLWGNTSVYFNTWGTEEGSCTAQVIHPRFLLTAAHCVLPDWHVVDINFTLGDGTFRNLYTGAAYSVRIPNWRHQDNDVAVVYVPSSLPVCGTSADTCRLTQPDIPVRAIFQFFDPAQTPMATFSSYNIAGYGTDDEHHNGATLRKGTSALLRSSWTDANNGLQLETLWSVDQQGNDTVPRTCAGDSGSALLTSYGGFLIHTGVLSGGSDCVSTTGTAVYTGMSLAQASWVVGAVRGMGGLAGVPVQCGGGTLPPNNLMFFIC